jgi:uncharacterized protein YodC (DUF2158 family)
MEAKMPSEFKAGDTVRLKSGGPIMTVIAMPLEGGCEASWFDGYELKRDTFAVAALEAVAPPHSGGMLPSGFAD